MGVRRAQCGARSAALTASRGSRPEASSGRSGSTSCTARSTVAAVRAHLPGCAALIARAASRVSPAAGGVAPSAAPPAAPSATPSTALRHAWARGCLGPRRRRSLGSKKIRLVAIISSGNSPSCHVRVEVSAAACTCSAGRVVGCCLVSGGGGAPATAGGWWHGRARRALGPRDGPGYRAARAAARAVPGRPLRRTAKPG